MTVEPGVWIRHNSGSIFGESGVLAPGTAASTGVLRIPALQLNEFSSYDVRLNGQ